MNKELLSKLRLKKKAYRQWKHGQIAWDGYRDNARVARNQVRKAKARLELNLAMNIKGNKKGFYRYIGDKRKTGEIVGPIWKEIGDLVT